MIGAKQEPHILASSTAFLLHYTSTAASAAKIPFSLLCTCHTAQNCGVMGEI